MLGKVVGVGTLLYVVANSISTGIAYKNTNAVEPAIKPSRKVSVIMCGYKEDESLIKRSITSLKNNNVVREYPEMFEFIYVGEPDIENRMYSVYNNFDKVIAAPKGKLTAKNIGIKNSTGEILVLVDVDKVYGYNWLNRMLTPFQNPDVVATTSATVFNYIIEPFANLPKKLIFMNRLDGGNSAYLKTAYYKAGGFNENINQWSWRELMQEEEVNFKKRIEKFGKVVFVDVLVESIQRPITPIRMLIEGDYSKR